MQSRQAHPVQGRPLGAVEALDLAETADYEGVEFRVVTARHLPVIALGVGRPKDWTRIVALLDADRRAAGRGSSRCWTRIVALLDVNAVTREELAELAARHGLTSAWQQFAGRFLDAT